MTLPLHLRRLTSLALECSAFPFGRNGLSALDPFSLPFFRKAVSFLAFELFPIVAVLLRPVKGKLHHFAVSCQKSFILFHRILYKSIRHPIQPAEPIPLFCR